MLNMSSPHLLVTVVLPLVVACQGGEEPVGGSSVESPAEAPAEGSVEEPADLFGEAAGALSACVADDECRARLEAVELGNCPWYEAVGCSTLTIAAGAACVVTEGEACLEALELVKAAGCCDCLPNGAVKDLCKSL